MDVHVEARPNGVAWITLVHPPVNALHPKLIEILVRRLRILHEEGAFEALVLRGNGGVFSAGFDVSTFRTGSEGSKKKNKDDEDMDAGIVQSEIEEVLERGKLPVVAVISGTALGGGLELAMACSARVAVQGSRFGLPELQLGILPGFGGTQRMPRLAGLQASIQAMLTSKPLDSGEASRVGLVDLVCESEEEAMERATELALKMARGKAQRYPALERNDRLPPLSEALQTIDRARKRPDARMPHAQLCLDAIEAGLLHGSRQGLKEESIAFARARSLPTHRALVHLFFAQRATKKLVLLGGPSVQGKRARPSKDIRVVAVIGGGLMGAGIATSLAFAGVEVLLKEVNDPALQAGMGRVHANIDSLARKRDSGGPASKGAERVKRRIRGVKDYADFQTCDMVIEAVIEDLGLKRRIFADLEEACRSDCILATNTSTIDLTLIGKACSPEGRKRLLGAHFFSPAHIMKLLEIVQTPETDATYVKDVLSLSAKMKKVPVVVGNCTGFAVNRVFFPYTMSACLLVDLGLDPYTIDRAVVGFGMPMGPFRLADLVGIDIGLHVGKNFVESFPERVYASPLLQYVHGAGRLGEKSGSGFYSYDRKGGKRKAVQDHTSIAPFLERSRKGSGLPPDAMVKLNLTGERIVETIFFPIVNEACRVISEAIVDKPSDLDVASVLAMGFPPFLGGLVWWADSKGAAYVKRRLDEMSGALPGQSGFFQPCEYLRRCASAKEKLGSGIQRKPRL